MSKFYDEYFWGGHTDEEAARWKAQREACELAARRAAFTVYAIDREGVEFKRTWTLEEADAARAANPGDKITRALRQRVYHETSQRADALYFGGAYAEG